MMHSHDLTTIDKHLGYNRQVRHVRRGAGVLLALALVAGCGGEAKSTKADSSLRSTATTEVSRGASAVAGLLGNCRPFIIYAQHDRPPDGAALRIAPNKLAPIYPDGIPGSTPLISDGYVVASEPTHPENPYPYQGYVWFHVFIDERVGWVNSAATRANAGRPEDYDPYNKKPATPIVTKVPECEVSPVEPRP